jgi:MFS family permease
LAGGDRPALALLGFAAVYGLAALGDPSVLSTAMSEAVPAAYLGRALAIRSIHGIGIGAAAPAAFGAVLDLSAPGHGWGWAFVLMGIGGVVATVCAALLPAAGAPDQEGSTAGPAGSTGNGDQATAGSDPCQPTVRTAAAALEPFARATDQKKIPQVEEFSAPTCSPL